MSVTFKCQTVVAVIQKIKSSVKACDRGTCGSRISFQLDSHLRAWCFSLNMIVCAVANVALCFRTVISVSFNSETCYSLAALPSMYL